MHGGVGGRGFKVPSYPDLPVTYDHTIARRPNKQHFARSETIDKKMKDSDRTLTLSMASVDSRELELSRSARLKKDKGKGL